ncbi:MAG: acyl-CoA synthetase FdrA [Acidimicrobiia bacterium]|nr:acyl-CoA synthetase FdrA [Acidimicrobiia bacterium]
MNTRHHIVPNTYKDSVALMAISSKLLALDGLEAASVVMATPTNLENLAAAGLAGDLATNPSDLIVAVGGTDAACTAAIELANDLLAERPVDGGRAAAGLERPHTSIQMAVDSDPALNFALVSVPGVYAAAEALKALRLGLSVMVFSDNVPAEQERAIKRYAARHGLMVMGPDCGTAIVNGLPLGFANVVRRGPIGVVGASGTGMQEVTSRVHNLGSGISQALGTGGHDLSDEIGGISMLTGLRALERDVGTEVIVLVSKPPAESVGRQVLDEARSMRTPVVVVFLGADPASFSRDVVRGVHTLAEAADLAVALVNGQSDTGPTSALDVVARHRLDDAVNRMAQGQRYLRGIFCGGTFCFEAQLVCLAAGIRTWSNTPVAGNSELGDIRVSREHTIIDMGDDQFTQGRPHPMIDPSLRDERVDRDAADPETAVLLVDVVLGHGSAADPISGLLEALGKARRQADSSGRHLAVVAHVCGTDADPQGRQATIARLESAGALVAESNAEAARWAAHMANRIAAT